MLASETQVSYTAVVIHVSGLKRTLIYRANFTSVGNKNVQTTKVGHGGSDHLFCPFHIAHIGGEGEDLCRRALAKDSVFVRIEGGLRTSNK